MPIELAFDKIPEPGKDKAGRKINPRQQLARRRNMLLGRIAFIKGSLISLDKQLRQDCSEFRDAGNIRASMSLALDFLSYVDRDVRIFYEEVHQIGIPKPTQENTDESK